MIVCVRVRVCVGDVPSKITSPLHSSCPEWLPCGQCLIGCTCHYDNPFSCDECPCREDDEFHYLCELAILHPRYWLTFEVYYSGASNN